MGRSSKKQLEDIERLHNENKTLREINKALSHRLKEESKKNKTTDPSELPVKVNLKKKDNDCGKCADGKIIHTDIGPRILITCSKCSYRKAIKNVKEDSKKEEEIQPKEQDNISTS